MEVHDQLQRFLDAQGDGTYERAVAELRSGRKASHWMWFVFPQIAGLGRSATSQRFAISSLEEAKAFLRHAVLGPRLIDCARILAVSEGLTASEIFGVIDELKLRSSMTLFMRADPNEGVFRTVLERFFGGIPDPATDRLLASVDR